MINPVIIFTFVTATFFLTNMCKAKKDKKKKKKKTTFITKEKYGKYSMLCCSVRFPLRFS